MVKYLKSPSTWIILVIAAFGLGFVLGGVLLSVVDLGDPTKQLRNYVQNAIAIVAGVTVFMTIFASVFAGFKSASMYKDEVENGTFLVILSKPIRRSTIILGKWLALQTLLVAYSFITVFTFCVAVAIFDRGKSVVGLAEAGFQPLSSQIANVGGFAFLIVYVASLIFSSIALLLSTKLPVSTTVGILIALGVIIPITSLLSILLRKPPITTFSSTAYLAASQRVPDQLAGIRKQFDKLADGLGEKIYPDLEAQFKNITSTVEATGIYNLAVKTNERDSYRSAWWLDFNFQFSTLAEFAYEKAIPYELRNQLLGANSNSAGVITTPKLEIDAVRSQSQILIDLDQLYQAVRPFGSAIAQLSSFNMLNQLELAAAPYTTADKVNELNFEMKREVFFTIELAMEQYRSLKGAQGTYSQRFLNFEQQVQQVKTSNSNLYSDTIKFSYAFWRSYLAFLFNFPLLSEIQTSANPLALLAEAQSFDLYAFLNYRVGLTNANADADLLVKNRLASTYYQTWAAFSTYKDFTPEARAVVDQTYTGMEIAMRPIRALYDSRVLNKADGVTDVMKLDEVQAKLNAAPQESGVTVPQAVAVPIYDVAAVESLLANAALDQIVTYTRKPYVDKNWLLAGYIIVALVLAPITYPIIRRQDFR